jgi:hypothetical protein
VGVFITAWAMALCFMLVNEPNWNALFLLLSTLGYYSLDHLLDLRKINSVALKSYTIWYFVLIVLSISVYLGLTIYLGFSQSIYGFLMRFWPTVLIGLLYLSLRFLKQGLFSAALKLLMIAFAAGFAIVFPAEAKHLLIAPLVCLSNVLVFSYLERKKDFALGNNGLFQVSSTETWLTYFLIVLAGTAVLMKIIFDVKYGFGAGIYSILALFMMQNESKFRQNTYRWWLDALLPVAFLPFG